jgi:hypothetical protein
VRDFVKAHNRVADVDSYLSVVDFWIVPMQLIDDESQLFERHVSLLLNINIPSDYAPGPALPGCRGFGLGDDWQTGVQRQDKRWIVRMQGIH